MCDFRDQQSLPPLPADQYVLDTSLVRRFVAEVRARIDRSESAAEACELIRPLFSELLRDRGWLPAAYQERAEESAMGGGIGTRSRRT